MYHNVCVCVCVCVFEMPIKIFKARQTEGAMIVCSVGSDPTRRRDLINNEKKNFF